MMDFLKKNVDTKIVVSGVVAAVAIGAMIKGARMLPSNSVTKPVKSAVELAR